MADKDKERFKNVYRGLENLQTLSEMAKKWKEDKEKTKDEELRPVSLEEFTEHIKETLQPKPKKKPKK